MMHFIKVCVETYVHERFPYNYFNAPKTITTSCITELSHDNMLHDS